MQHSRLSTNRSASAATSTTSGAMAGRLDSSSASATPRPSIVSPASARTRVMVECRSPVGAWVGEAVAPVERHEMGADQDPGLLQPGPGAVLEQDHLLVAAM